MACSTLPGGRLPSSRRSMGGTALGVPGPSREDNAADDTRSLAVVLSSESESVFQCVASVAHDKQIVECVIPFLSRTGLSDVMHPQAGFFTPATFAGVTPLSQDGRSCFLPSPSSNPNVVAALPVAASLPRRVRAWAAHASAQSLEGTGLAFVAAVPARDVSVGSDSAASRAPPDSL